MSIPQIKRHVVLRPADLVAASTLREGDYVWLTVNVATGERAHFRLGRMWAEDPEQGVNSPIVADTFRVSTGEWDLVRFTPGQRVIVCTVQELDMSGQAVIIAEAFPASERRW